MPSNRTEEIQRAFGSPDGDEPTYSVLSSLCTNANASFAYSNNAQTELDANGAHHSFKIDTKLSKKEQFLQHVVFFSSQHGAAQREAIGAKETITTLVTSPACIATSSEFFALKVNAMTAAVMEGDEEVRSAQVSAALFGAVVSELITVHVLPTVEHLIAEAGCVNIDCGFIQEEMGDPDLIGELVSDLSLAAVGHTPTDKVLRNSLRMLDYYRTTKPAARGTA